MHITDFIERYNPVFWFNRVDSRPHVHNYEIDRKYHHYLISITTTRGNLIEFYSTPESIKEGPFLVNVLEVMICNAVCGDMTYREACREVDGVVDYQEWQSCRETRDKLIDTFGRDGFQDLLSADF